MSDASQGPGWWQASDLKWYPPETHPEYRPLPPPPPPAAIPPPPPPPVTAPGQYAQPNTGPLEVKGVNGTVIFDGQFVTIRRSGLMARATVGKGEKRIPVRSIAAIQFKPAGMVRGFIQFTVPGGNERQSSFGSQSTDAAKDENSVLFGKSDQAAFENLRNAIESRLV